MNKSLKIYEEKIALCFGPDESDTEASANDYRLILTAAENTDLSEELDNMPKRM